MMLEEERIKYAEALYKFQCLPKLSYDSENDEIVKGDEYSATLYHYDEEWCIDWVSSEGDSIKIFTDEDIIKAIENAYQWAVKEILIKC